VPIKNEHGDIISAVGVSGSSVENEHIVAEAGVLGIVKNNKNESILTNNLIYQKYR
jgi:uncharacterized protein GlcG (DUF336 family)